jgi:hypothetical protein
MPTAYIKKLAKLNHKPAAVLEKYWDKAKAIVKEQGKSNAWGLVTTIFQNILKKEGMKITAIYLYKGNVICASCKNEILKRSITLI